MNVCPITNSLLHSILWRRKKLICQSYHGFLSLTFGMSCNVTASRGGYSHTLPIRVCAAQRGRDFEAPDLERGIHFTGVF